MSKGGARTAKKGKKGKSVPVYYDPGVNGIHDMGGMHGFGLVEVEADEPVFHGRWEARVFGMTGVARLRLPWNIDAGRHGLERLDPVTYLANGYYGRWFARLEQSLLELGVLRPG